MALVTHALLLTAGLGTRLRPLTLVRAKPAMPIGQVPMARRIIAWLASQGVTDVVLNLHHLPATLAAVVGDGADLGVRARYSWEHPEVLGSAGGPRQALDIIGANRFLVVNGDTLTDLSVAPLIAAHQIAGGLVTLAVIPNLEPGRYSGLAVDGDGAVRGVVPRGSTTPSFHFVGVQVVEREAFAGLPAGAAAASIGGLYDRLIADRPGRVRAHRLAAQFWDIGTVADYWRTSHLLAPAPGARLAADTRIGTGARLTDCITWSRVVVGDGCQVERCIITDDVQLEPGTSYANTILMRGRDGQLVTAPFAPDTP